MLDEDPVTAGAGPIRVLLVEHHRLMREAITLLLEREPDLALVGQAADGAAGLRLLARLTTAGAVDVVVADIGLPDLDGLALTRRAKARAPGIPVVLLTLHDGEEYLRAMLAAGADGYVLKQATGQDLCAAIRAALRGEPELPPAVAGQLLGALRQGAPHGRRRFQLSERERQVLGLLAAGLTSQEVGQRLGLGEQTVESHRAQILEKLGVTNIAAAIGLAHRHGLLDGAGYEGAGP